MRNSERSLPADAIEDACDQDEEAAQTDQTPSIDPKKPPHLQLIAQQVRLCGGSNFGRPDRYVADCTLDMFRGLQPRNTVEAMLAALAVGLHNQTMTCITTCYAVNQQDSESKMKYAIKGAAAEEKLLSLYQKLRATKPSSPK